MVGQGEVCWYALSVKTRRQTNRQTVVENWTILGPARRILCTRLHFRSSRGAELVLSVTLSSDDLCLYVWNCLDSALTVA